MPFLPDPRLRVEKSGTVVGTRGGLNLIPGAGITLTVTDDAANDEVDVTVAASAGSGTTSLQTAGSTTDNVVTPSASATAVDSLEITVAGSAAARTVSVSFSVEIDTADDRRFTLTLDGTHYWPKNTTGVVTRDGHNLRYITASGVAVDIPGDSADHTIRVAMQAHGNFNSTTISHRSLTVVDPGA